jgi:hypothetical protein
MLKFVGGAIYLKVKIFCSCDLGKLEKDINDYIKDKYVISINPCHTKIYQHQTKTEIPYLTITVLYDDSFSNGYVKFPSEQEILNNINGSVTK